MNKKLTSFRDFIREDTDTGDVANVDKKLDTTVTRSGASSASSRSDEPSKGKKCKKHDKINCKECKGGEHDKVDKEKTEDN